MIKYLDGWNSISNMFRNQIFSKGVSPVIGVILMVAVTVALVALITVVVFDLGGDVSDSPDATVQLEEESNSVTATVIRNENVQDFTIKFKRQSGTSSTKSLSSTSGSSETVTDTVIATSEEEFGANHGNGVAAPIQNGDTIDLSNDKFKSFNLVEGDSTTGDGVNYDTGDIQSSWTVEDQSGSVVKYTGSTDLDNVKINYDYQTSTDALSKVTVIANMPDGSKEVLTRIKLDN
jgi:flagellin-like protein